MKTLKGAFALLLLTGFFLALSVSLFAHPARAHAEFNTWANRSSRVCEPVGYNTTGTCTCHACKFTEKMNTIGNLGIGNGNISLMRPSFINDAMRDFNDRLNAGMAPERGAVQSEMPANTTVKNSTAMERPVQSADVGRTPASTEPGTCPTCQVAAEEVSEGLTESLSPSNLLAAGITREGTADTITFGHPLPHIMNEEPSELGVLYSKLIGLPMPDGSRMDIGIKSVGYEY